MKKFQKFPPDGNVIIPSINSFEASFNADGSVTFVPYSAPSPFIASDVDIPSLLIAGITPQSSHEMELTPVDSLSSLQQFEHEFDNFKS
ncbi:hypothetical protein [Capybara microvirus Cap3_SP_347]|nr:hypothetical protein [Capybara microvirus Cap3_SP_347]